jgi:acetyl esterase/lipase
MGTEDEPGIKWTAENVPYGINAHQTFNIVIPKKDTVHAVVYIHGGFYLAGNKLWYPQFLTDFARNNIFATIDYRLLTQINNTVHMDDMIKDVNDALTKITETAKENGVIISDFTLVGHSSGAHIALLYAYTYLQKNNTGQIAVASCVSLAGPTDYTDDAGWSGMAYYGESVPERLATLSWIGTELIGYPIQLTREKWTEQNNYAEFKDYVEAISPVTYVNTHDTLPPTLLVHGQDDHIVPYSNSVRLKASLDTTSVPHNIITPAGSGNNHMLGGEPPWTYSVVPIRYKDQPWVKEAKEWMEVYLQ